MSSVPSLSLHWLHVNLSVMQSSISGSLNYICPCFVHALTKTKISFEDTLSMFRYESICCNLHCWKYVANVMYCFSETCLNKQCFCENKKVPVYYYACLILALRLPCFKLILTKFAYCLKMLLVCHIGIFTREHWACMLAAVVWKYISWCIYCICSWSTGSS